MTFKQQINETIARNIIRLLPHRTDDEIAERLTVDKNAVKDIRERRIWTELPRKKVITEEMAIEIRRLRAQNLSWLEIGNRLGVSDTTVGRYLERVGTRYKLKPHYLPAVDEIDPRILPAYKDKGWTTFDKDGRTTLTRLGLHVLAKCIVNDRLTYADASRYLRIPLKDLRHQLKLLDIKKGQLWMYIDERLDEAEEEPTPPVKKERQLVPGFNF